MLYPNLKFRTPKNRPFFYTNFVQTLDGKVAVKGDGYWPIGSKTDHEVMVELRAHADALIHGKNLYKEFGNITAENLKKASFRSLRAKLGRNPDLPYYQATHNLKKLVQELKNKGYKNVLIEGGPTLLGSFLKEGLLDEIFITIAPKIYGTKEGQTLTLVEGYLFPKNSTKKLRLNSVKPIKDELFLRYSVEN